MNRPALSRKPDWLLVFWLLAQTAACWTAAALTDSPAYWLWPSASILAGGAGLYLLDKTRWHRTWKIQRYPILIGLMCVTAQLWEWSHSFPAVLLHMVTVLMMAALYFRARLIWGVGFAYAMGWLLFPASSGFTPDAGRTSVVLSALLMMVILHLLHQLGAIYREHLAQIRMMERDDNMQRMGRQQHLATIGQIAASIAHDIRNPLTSIQGFIQLIERQERRTGYLEYYRIIRSEISRIDTLIREVLILSKSHTMDMESWERVDLADLLKRLITLMEPDSLRCNIQVELEMQQAPVIMGSEDKLHQVFLNILRNAFEAVAEQGVVRIVLTVADGMAAVSIRDSGPGIPESKLGNLFTPFFTTKEEGTGLGLSICQSIIKAYGGRIDVRNSPEGGAEFVVRLPLSAALPAGEAQGHETIA